MKPRSLLIGVGVTCFIAFVLVALPARVITALLPADLIKISGISGTLWNGQARLIQVSNVPLTATKWTLHPWQLVIGRLALSIETQCLGSAVSGDLRLGITGAITVSNVDALGPLAPLASLMKIPQSGGDFSMRIEEVSIKNAWPLSAVGSVRVGNLPLNIMGVAAGPVGTYEVTFTSDPVPEDGRIVGEMQDLGGPLKLGGAIFLDPPRNYELSARVKGGPGAPQDLVRGLALLGPADANGNHELIMSGSF